MTEDRDLIVVHFDSVDPDGMFGDYYAPAHHARMGMDALVSEIQRLNPGCDKPTALAVWDAISDDGLTVSGFDDPPPAERRQSDIDALPTSLDDGPAYAPDDDPELAEKRRIRDQITTRRTAQAAATAPNAADPGRSTATPIPTAVVPFDDHEYMHGDYLGAQNVPPSVAKVCLATVADGDANDYKQYGERAWVARVGRVVLAAQWGDHSDMEVEPVGLRLRAFQLPTREHAIERYGEVISLMNVGGW